MDEKPTYTNHIDVVMKFTVGFSRSKEWYALGSTAIQIAEKRPYSHAYVRYQDPWTGADLVAQAAHGFVNQFGFKLFCEKNAVIEEYQFEVDPEKFRLLVASIENNLGKPYGYLELIWIAVQKLFHIKVNIHDHDESFICSEFVGTLLSILDIIKPGDLDYLTPSDLNKLVKDKFNK